MDVLLSQRDRRRRRLYRRLQGYAVLIGVVLAAWGAYYLLFETPILKINSIEIVGQNQVSQQIIMFQLAQIVGHGLTGQLLGADNYLAWSAGTFIINNPVIAEVEVKKEFFGKKIIIQAKEREKYGIWCLYRQDQKSCFWFDRDGFIFSKASEGEGNILYRLTSTIAKTDPLPAVASTIVAKDNVAHVKKILAAVTTVFQINELRLDTNHQEITAVNTNGLKLLFSIRFDPEENIAALQELMKKIHIQALSYIDLRVENRIFYK